MKPVACALELTHRVNAVDADTVTSGALKALTFRCAYTAGTVLSFMPTTSQCFTSGC